MKITSQNTNSKNICTDSDMYVTYMIHTYKLCMSFRCSVSNSVHPAFYSERYKEIKTIYLMSCFCREFVQLVSFFFLCLSQTSAVKYSVGDAERVSCCRTYLIKNIPVKRFGNDGELLSESVRFFYF